MDITHPFIIVRNFRQLRLDKTLKLKDILAKSSSIISSQKQGDMTQTPAERRKKIRKLNAKIQSQPVGLREEGKEEGLVELRMRVEEKIR